MSSKDTHRRYSKWSCFGNLVFAGKRENAFLLFRCMPVCIILYAVSKLQVRLDSLTYFELLFPAPSLASLKFNQI